MQFHEILQREFEARKTKNVRYSLRAFAAALEVDHSTLSQMLRGARRVPAQQIRLWAHKLGMAQEEAAVYVAASHAASPEEARRAQQLLHWTAEALAVMNEAAHFEILRLSRDARFQPDVRWIAQEAGLTTDEINTALTRLLRLRLIEMTPNGWSDLSGLNDLTERKVRRLALERVRQAAAENGIQLGRKKQA